MDCHFLIQGIFPTQGSNPGLLHGRRSHQGGPSSNMTGGLTRRGNVDTDTHRGRPCGATGRRRPWVSQGERSQKKPSLPMPGSWTSSLHNCEEILLLIHPSLCCFLMAAPVHEYKSLSRVRGPKKTYTKLMTRLQSRS